MSDSCVTLALQINHVPKYTSDFQGFESLALEHSELNTDFMDGHYLVKVASCKLQVTRVNLDRRLCCFLTTCNLQHQTTCNNN